MGDLPNPTAQSPSPQPFNSTTPKTGPDKKNILILALLAAFVVLAILSIALVLVRKKPTQQTTAGGAQVYQPKEDNPFKTLPGKTFVVSKPQDKNCEIVQYTIFGPVPGVIYAQMRANYLNCPDVDGFNYNQNSYKRNLSLVDKNDPTINVTKKKIGQDDVLVVLSRGIFQEIDGIKGSTLVIVAGGCPSKDSKECVQKYEDFYASL